MGADAAGFCFWAYQGARTGIWGIGFGAGLLGGAGSSILAARELKGRINIQTNEIFTEYLRNLELAGGDETDEAGLIHNIIVQELIEKYGEDYIDSLDRHQLSLLIVEELQNAGYDMTEVTSNFDFYLYEHEEVQEEIINSDFEAIVEQHPEMYWDMGILNLYIENIDTIPEEMLPEFTVGFRNLINNSNIPRLSIDNLRGTISTAMGSSILWL